MNNTDILEKYKKALLEIYKEKNNDKLFSEFNVFTTIANTYKKENLHSDIIKTILGQERNDFQKKEILTCFLEYIGLSSEEVESFNKTPISVLRENNRIDVLIRNDNSAIIIENKINDAKDMDNQLARYYEKITENYSVLKIVYITRLSGRKPDFQSYDSQYEETIKKIQEKIVFMSACDGKNSFLGFLEKCLVLADNENDISKKGFLLNYIDVIKYIGKNAMCNENEKDLIVSIFSNKDSITAVNQLVDSWENRGAAIFEKLKQDLSTFTNSPIMGYDCLVTEYPDKHSGKYLYGCRDFLQLGYYNENGFSKREIEEYSQKIQNLGIEPNIFQKKWIYFNFVIDCSKTYSEIKEEVKTHLENL